MTKNIIKDIEVILQAELNKFQEIGRRSGGLGSVLCTYEGREYNGPPPEWRVEGFVRTRSIILDAPQGSVHSENIDTLLRLYSSLDNEGEKRMFKEVLLGHLRKVSPYQDIAYFIIWAFQRLGDLQLALNIASGQLLEAGGFVIDDIVRLLDTLVRFEGRYLESRDLDAIEQFLRKIPSNHHYRLEERITDARLEILRGRLGEVNPAINEDRDKAIHLWSQEFQNKELENLVKQIEDMFAGGEMDATQFATAMDRIRALIVEVSKRIVEKVVELTRKEYKGDWDNEQAIFNYLTRDDIKFLTQREKGLIIDIYGLCSDKGAHKIIAEREYARLTKNITYELFLLLMEKFQKFKQTEK